MPAGSTYSTIATYTLTSKQASVTFSSIPSTYTDLVLVMMVDDNTSGYDWVRFNGDSGNNYSRTMVSGNGTSASSGRTTNSSGYDIGTGDTPPTFPLFIMNIMNYANTTTYKTFLSRFNRVSEGVQATVGLWRNTAAITSISINTPIGGADLNIGSTFTLYGIAAA